MADKKTLKKSIKYICGSLAGECIFSKFYYENPDIDKINELVCKLGSLQVSATDKVSVNFDKTLKKDFNKDVKAYKKARKEFFKAYYDGVLKEFNEETKKILSEMNAMLTAEQKELNKKIAQAE